MKQFWEKYYFNKVSILNWMDKIGVLHMNIMITILSIYVDTGQSPVLRHYR